MDSSTRQRALEAAAKVAIAFSAFGCGTTGLAATTTIGDYTDAPAESVQDGAAAATLDSGGSSQSEAGDDLVAEASADPYDAANAYDAHAMHDGASEAQMPMCNDLISQRIPDGSSSFAKSDQDDPEVQACCTAMIAPLQSGLGAGLPGSLGWACCEIPAVARAFLACTPWGPPVPPPMPSAWSNAWEVA